MQLIMQSMSGVSTFTHVCGQTVETLAAKTVSIAVIRDTLVFVVYGRFVSCYIRNFCNF